VAKFKRGQSGNPAGRPRGSKNASTRLRAALADQLEDVIERVVAEAKSGSANHARLILERVLPALKPIDETVKVPLAGSLSERAWTVVNAVGTGRLTPDQAGRVMALLADEARILETDRLFDRVAALERQMMRSTNDDA